MKKSVMILLSCLFLFPLIACARGEAPDSAISLQGVNETYEIIVPAAFVVQRIENASHGQGRYYIFTDPDTPSTFIADMVLDDPHFQRSFLKDLRSSDSLVVLNSVVLGSHHFLAYHEKGIDCRWKFLLLTENGYRYRFSYETNPLCGLDEIPEPARKILSSLKLTGGETQAAPEIAFPTLPGFDASSFPAPHPIDPSNKQESERQMEAYCRALLSGSLGIALSDAPALVDWTPALIPKCAF